MTYTTNTPSLSKEQAYNYRATTHKRLPRPRPLPFGSLMNALLQIIENTSVRDGFSHASTKWLSSQLGCTEPYVNQMLRRLSYEYGRVRIREVEGSHERHLFPIPLDPVFSSRKSIRKSSQNLTESGDTLSTIDTYPTDKKQETNTEGKCFVDVLATLEEERETVDEAQAVEPSPIPAYPESKSEESIAAPVELSEPVSIEAQLVAELKAEGVKSATAEKIVAKYIKEPRRVSRNLTYARRMSGPGKDVGNLAGYVVAAITANYAEGLDLSQVGVTGRDPDRKREYRRAPQESRPTPKPPSHCEHVPEDWERDEPASVTAPPRPAQVAVGVSEATSDPLAGLSPMKRWQAMKGGK